MEKQFDNLNIKEEDKKEEMDKKEEKEDVGNDEENKEEKQDNNDNEEKDDKKETDNIKEDEVEVVKEEENPLFKCNHYKRKCQLLSPCCDKYYTCRLCHDDAYQYNKGCQEERMDRHKVSKVKCLQCETTQEPAKNCKECSISFGLYTCLVCNFFDDDDKKQIYHCVKCGICRMGDASQITHCDKCDVCFPNQIFNGHYCKSRKDEVCGVCLEDFFHSRKGMTKFPQCNHPIHSTCLMQMFKSGNINCPICGRSYSKEDDETIKKIDEIVEKTNEFFVFEGKPMFDDILCMNCMGHTKQVRFNAYGMKCGECGSYNTKKS